MREKYNRTLLFSSDSTKSAADLSEPVTNFEFFEVGNTRQYLIPSTANLNQGKFAQVAFWQNQGYIDKQQMYKITNNGQHLEAINFQYILQQGSADLRVLGSAVNRSNNINFFDRVYGVNRISGEETTAEGIKPEGENWKNYDETLLTTGDTYGQSAIELIEPARGFERIRVQVGSYTESPNCFEYNAPWYDDDCMTTHAYWGANTGSNYLNFKRWIWKNNTNTLSAYNGGMGKSFQLGFNSGAANSLTALTGSTANDNWIKRDIRKVWGINRRPTFKVNLKEHENGEISFNNTSGFEHDKIVYTAIPDENYNFSAIKVNDDVITANNFIMPYDNVNITASFTDIAPNTITLQTQNGTLSCNRNSGYSGYVCTLSNTANAGYNFDSYSITGATLTSNQFMITGSNVNVSAKFSVASSQLYSNTSLTRTAHGSKNISISKAITAQPYWAIKFEQSGTWTSPAAFDLYLRFNNGSWNTRAHSYIGNYKGVRNGGNFTIANSNVKNASVDSSTLRYYTSVSYTTNGTYRFVGDRANNRVSAFINNTYLGYGTIDAITSISNLGIQSEQYGYIAVKNIYLAVFGNLADAVKY